MQLSNGSYTQIANAELQKVAHEAALADYDKRNGESQQQVVANNEGTGQQIVGSPSDTQNASQPFPMRKTENGEEPDYLAASPERTHNYVYNENDLTEEEATAFVDNKIAEAEKKLSEAQAMPAPKMGNDIAKYRAEKESYQQSIADAQKEVDYWNSVKSMHSDGAVEQQSGNDSTIRELKKREFDRTIPSTVVEQKNAIYRIVEFAKNVKDKVERAVIGGITEKQAKDFKEKGIEGIDGTWVHSFESSAVAHNQNEHGDEKAESKKGQIAISEEDYKRIPDILNDYDKVYKSPSLNKRSQKRRDYLRKGFWRWCHILS